MFTKDETILLRRGLDALKARIHRSLNKTDHEAIYNLMKKDMFLIDELMSKLEIV
jgi:hypothetical protein